MKRALFGFGATVLALVGLAAGCSVAGKEDGGAETAAGAGGDNTGGTDLTTAEGGGGGNTGDPIPPANKAGGDGAQDDADDGQTASEDPKLTECTSGLTPVAFFLSADDSNSMASPILAREWLRSGQAPPFAQIRTYEFLNYYNALYDLPESPEKGLGVHVELHEEQGVTDLGLHLRLQVGVQAFDVPRVPLVLTYVIDTSGSLVGAGMERAREALLALSGHLEKGDILNVVTWSNKDNVLLDGYVATGDDAGKLAQVVSNLVPGGGSDLHAGLTEGYALAASHFAPDRLNRVILVSDGGANLGVLDRDVIEEAAAKADADGIYLVGVGVGPAKGYSDNLMNLVTDAGRGAYVYLDGKDEATDIFTTRFDEVMRVAARDVRVQLELPPYLEIDHFYGEEYSEDESVIEPQHLAPGDSMIFNQTLYSTNLGAVCGLDPITVRVRWETPLTHEIIDADPVTVDLNTLLAQPLSRQMAKANAVIAYAEALKSGDPGALGAAYQKVNDASLADPADGDLADIRELILLHPQAPQPK